MKHAPWNPETALGWLQEALPSPVQRTSTQSGYILLAGEPVAVVVRVNAAALRIGVFGVQRWREVSALSDEPIASITWSKLPADEASCREVVAKLASAAALLHAARVLEAS